MRAGVTLLVVSLVIVSGCVSDAPPKETCEGEGCVPPTTTINDPPPIDPHLPLPNLTVPAFQMTGCQNYLLSFQVPRDNVRNAVPDAFWLVVLTDQTATIKVLVNECDRVVNGTEVYGPGNLYWTAVPVEPKNETWTREGYINWYLLDVASDIPSLVDFLGSQTLPVETATFSTEQSPIPEPYGVSQKVVEGESWKTTFDLSWDPISNAPDNVTHAAHLWVGDGPFRRIESTSAGYAYYNPFGPVIMEGDCGTCDLMASPATLYSANVERDYAEVWQFQGVWV